MQRLCIFLLNGDISYDQCDDGDTDQDVQQED